MTFSSLTLSWMPHCTPQKQQWVLTSRSGVPRPCQPPGGVSWRWGPYCAISCAVVCGRVVMEIDSLRDERPSSAKAPHPCPLPEGEGEKRCAPPHPPSHVLATRPPDAAGSAGR